MSSLIALRGKSRAVVSTDFEEHRWIKEALTNPEAFSALYRRYFPRVYAYLAYRVGNARDAEDLTSEVFLRVVEALSSFVDRGDGAFAAWLFAIARRCLADFYRKRPPETIALDELSIDELPQIHGMQYLPPDAAFLGKERFARLRQMIGTLAPRRQEIITLRFFAELQNKEIAVVLGLDERTVASHLCRALDDLQRYRQELEGYPDDFQ